MGRSVVVIGNSEQASTCASPIFGLLLITHAELHTPTTLTTKAAAARGQSSDTVVRRQIARAPIDSPGIHVGRPTHSVRRRVCLSKSRSEDRVLHGVGALILRPLESRNPDSRGPVEGVAPTSRLRG